ncbi:ankyrin repeat domain-containing protein [Campylobacter geochelonis]|uniref:Ankyrin repeat family protein n=1 Tax=Campylobacter geochelonis TaxID=1780362 RepID=A0A128EDA6_9BACT|nr:ankyrin repeat domain-containing protein [Campylobacter geochelonis]QKF70911.1 ankyrin domain-containing protein [Campylobacter geochelonis]CZE46945.1 ankyrin repeat family protein [Campylobacter geochelonis]CZE51242.1 ankyrin repeat family protein [Campylobacter geochelonis]
MVKTLFLLPIFTIFTYSVLFAFPADSFGQNPKDIFYAIEKGDTDLLKNILKSKPNLEAKNSQGQTPLMYATYKFNNEIAFLLIDAGASVNTQDNMLNSPFLYAGAQGNLELVKKALKHGADFNVFNRYGGTALIPAAEKGHLEVVKLLVNTPNFPKDHINNLGWTALLEAVILGSGGKVHTQIVQELVNGGCDVNIADRDGVTALKHAKNRGYEKIVKILEKAGAR